jgi:hypothetical protein
MGSTTPKGNDLLRRRGTITMIDEWKNVNKLAFTEPETAMRAAWRHW